MILRIDDPWWSDLSIKAFLVPFMNGWMMLGVAGAIYRRVPVPRFDRAAFATGLASMLAALVSLGWPALHGARIPPLVPLHPLSGIPPHENHPITD